MFFEHVFGVIVCKFTKSSVGFLVLILLHQSRVSSSCLLFPMFLTHACTLARTHARALARSHARARARAHTHIHTYARTHKHALAHPHTRVQVAAALLRANGGEAAARAVFGGTARRFYGLGRQ